MIQKLILSKMSLVSCSVGVPHICKEKCFKLKDKKRKVLQPYSYIKQSPLPLPQKSRS